MKSESHAPKPEIPAGCDTGTNSYQGHEMNDTDAGARLAEYPLETRMRWYAEMNSWKVPADFPFTLPDFSGDHRAQSDHPEWKAAWNALTATLTDEESSLGWWLFALNRTEAEWREWWRAERRREPTVTLAAHARALLAPSTQEAGR